MSAGQGWGAAGQRRGRPRSPGHVASRAQVIEKEQPQLTECEEPSIYSPAFPREKWQRKRTQVKIRVRARPLGSSGDSGERGPALSPQHPRPSPPSRDLPGCRPARCSPGPAPSSLGPAPGNQEPPPLPPLIRASDPSSPHPASSSASRPVTAPLPGSRSPHTGTRDLGWGSGKRPPLGPRSSCRGPAPTWARVPLSSCSCIHVVSRPRSHAVSSRQNVTSNHRASDTVVCEGRPQVLNGRFMYGPLDVVTLTGEKVRTRRSWPRVDPPPSSRPRTRRELSVPSIPDDSPPRPSSAQAPPHGPPRPLSPPGGRLHHDAAAVRQVDPLRH